MVLLDNNSFILLIWIEYFFLTYLVTLHSNLTLERFKDIIIKLTREIANEGMDLACLVKNSWLESCNYNRSERSAYNFHEYYELCKT